MGPNGVGKSTLSKVLMGYPEFQIKYNFFKALIYLKEYQWHKRMHFKGCIFSAKIGEQFQSKDSNRKDIISVLQSLKIPLN